MPSYVRPARCTCDVVFVKADHTHHAGRRRVFINNVAGSLTLWPEDMGTGEETVATICLLCRPVNCYTSSQQLVSFIIQKPARRDTTVDTTMISKRKA